MQPSPLEHDTFGRSLGQAFQAVVCFTLDAAACSGTGDPDRRSQITRLCVGSRQRRSHRRCHWLLHLHPRLSWRQRPLPTPAHRRGEQRGRQGRAGPCYRGCPRRPSTRLGRAVQALRACKQAFCGEELACLLACLCFSGRTRRPVFHTGAKGATRAAHLPLPTRRRS